MKSAAAVLAVVGLVACGGDGDVATPDAGATAPDVGATPDVRGADTVSADTAGEETSPVLDAPEAPGDDATLDAEEVEAPPMDAEAPVEVADDVGDDLAANLGDEAAAETTEDVPPDTGSLTCEGMGLTWFQLKEPAPDGTVQVACGDATGACDPYQGDTPCTEARPVLCVHTTGSAAPGTPSVWFAGETNITAPVQGCVLTSIAAADAICSDAFGPEWRMAEWHDGAQGDTGSADVIGSWTFSAFGSWTSTDRLWIAINDQPANCFPLPPTYCCSDAKPCEYGPCVDGYCTSQIPVGLAPGLCFEASQCGLGYTCELGPATAVCEEGGWLEPGACVANGPGGLCPVYPGDVFGTCETTLGYLWTGFDCVEVHGCDCGDYCGAMHATYEACVAACAPPLCCASDVECGGTFVCYNGFCVSPAPEGQCWSSEECSETDVCSGPSSCACGGTMKCAVAKKKACKKGVPCPAEPPSAAINPGKCLYQPTCCATTDDCGDGEVCVLALPGNGTCRPAPTGVQCWTSADCASGEACAFVAACPCDVGCVSHAGSCAPLPEVCCTSDGDCDGGQICSAMPAGAWGGAIDVGQCVEPPFDGACFTSAQCGESDVCMNPWVWPCGVVGSTPVGTCASGQGQCCATDADCPEAMGCIGTPGFEPQSCQDKPPQGQCWTNADCAPGDVCSGATTGWGCGGPDLGAAPGTCVSPEGLGCCADNAECGEGMACTAKASPGPGDFVDAALGLCVSAPTEGQCLHTWDCPTGLACSGAPGWPCGKLAGGYGGCVNPIDYCCSSNAQCPEGTHCVGEKPGVSGQCSFPPDGDACWEDGDCDAGKTCKGANVCSACVNCPEEETLGTCVAQ